MSRPKRGAPSQFVANPFVPGDLVRRMKEFVTSGGWKGGRKVFTVEGMSRGHLRLKGLSQESEFYYGYFERAK